MFETIEEYFRQLFLLPKNPNKKNWEKVFYDMSIHTRKTVPTELLLKRRPNEEEHIYNYRIANYEPITYGSMNKALDDLFRIINGISYKINGPDEFIKQLDDIEFSGYTNDARHEELSLELFLQKIVLKRMIEDPNGFLIWFPYGEGITDNSKEVEVTPKLIYSSQYVYSDNNVFIYMSDEKSPLRSGKSIELKGDVYYFLDRNSIWKMKQVGTLSKPTWVQELVYQHNLGVFPVIILGGDINSDGYYNSFFTPYIAFGNEAIRQFSDWQGVMTTSSFPYIEEFANECTFQVINKNSNQIPDQEEKFSGSGNQTKLIPLSKSPYNVTLRKIPSGNINEDVLPVDIPSRRFISPDIEVARYSGESWEKLIEKAELALNIDLTVGVDQSGVAKQIDKESQYSMISKIGNNFFDNIFLKSLQLIDGYINVKEVDNEVTIVKPSTFWVKNEDDLVNELALLKEKNVPSFFLAETTLELANKRFSGSPVSKKIFANIALYDPLYIYTIDEKNTLVASTVIDKDEYIRSIYMFGILHQIAMEKTASVFMEMTPQQINTEFEVRVAPYLSKGSVMQLVNPDGSTEGSVQGGDINTPVDIEAESKAKLKGTVGGVQGILAIQDSVSKGITDYNSAVALLFEIYGFDDKTARKLLGTPKKQIISGQ